MAKQTTTTTKTPIKVTKFQTPTTGAQNSTTTKTKTTTATAETAKAGRNYEALARQQADIAAQRKQQTAKQTRATESYNRAQADIAAQQKQQTAKQTRATENYERAQSDIAKQQAKKTYGSNSTAGEIFNKVTTGKSYSSGSNYTSAGMQTARTKIDSLYQNSVKPLYDNYLKLYEGYKNGTVSADEVNAAIDDYESVYNEYNPLQTAYEQLRTASAYHVTTTEEAKAMADQVDTAITAINQRLRTNAANMAQAELDLNKANEAYSKNPSAANYYTVTKAQSKYEAARGLYNASVFVAQESQTLYGDIQNTATELYNDYLEKNPNIYLDGDTAESVQKRLDKYQSTYDTAKERYEKALTAYRANTYENKALSSEGAVQTQGQKLSSQSITNEYKAAKAEYERISGTYEGIKSLKDWLSDDDNLASRDKWEENNWTWDKVYNLYEQTGDVQYLDELVYGYGRFVETEEQEDKLVEAASKLFDEAKTLLYEAQGGTLAETKSEAAEEEARAKYWEAQENYKAAQKRLHEMGQVATRTDEVISGVLDVVVTDYTSLAAYAGDVVKWGLKAVGADEAAASIGAFTEVIRKDRQAAQEAFSTAMTNMGETETFVLGLVPSAIEMGFSAMAAKVLGAGKSYTSVAEATKGMTGVAKLGKTTRTVLHNMAQNPQYWTSFARVVGTDYVDAVNEGHDESSAFLYATVDAALNAAIEIGIGPTSSGVQGLYETETAMANPTVRKAFKETLLKTAHEEGMEEVKQGIVERALSVALLGEERQLFGTTRSTEDRDAVLSLSSALEEYIGGAALSALVSVPRTVSSVSVGAARENALRKLNTLNLTLPEELRMNKLDVQKATDAQAEDYRLALLLRLNAANSLTKANVNARADQIQAAAEKANSDKKVLGPIASELQEKGYNDANGAQVQQDLIEKILNGTKLSDEEIKKLDLNNRIVREVFVKRTGLSGTPTDAVIPLDAIRVYADTAATLAQRVQVRQQELIAQQQREEAELKTAAEAKAATETTVQPQPQTQTQTQTVEAQTAETPVQEKTQTTETQTQTSKAPAQKNNPFKNRRSEESKEIAVTPESPKASEMKGVGMTRKQRKVDQIVRQRELAAQNEIRHTAIDTTGMSVREVINRISGSAGVANIQTFDEWLVSSGNEEAQLADPATSIKARGDYRSYLTKLGLTSAETDAIIRVQDLGAKKLTKQETDSYTEPTKEEVKEHGSNDVGGNSETAGRAGEEDITRVRYTGGRGSATRGGENDTGDRRDGQAAQGSADGRTPASEGDHRLGRVKEKLKRRCPEGNIDTWEEADTSKAPGPVKAAYDFATNKLAKLVGADVFFVRADKRGVSFNKANWKFTAGLCAKIYEENHPWIFVCTESPNKKVRYSARAALHEPVHAIQKGVNAREIHTFVTGDEAVGKAYEDFRASPIGKYYATSLSAEYDAKAEEEFLCRVFAGQLGDASMQEKVFDFLAEHNEGLAELRDEYFQITKNLEAYYAEQDAQDSKKAKAAERPVGYQPAKERPQPQIQTPPKADEQPAPKTVAEFIEKGEPKSGKPETDQPTAPSANAAALANKYNVDLKDVEGTGAKGRILLRDVERYLAETRKDIDPSEFRTRGKKTSKKTAEEPTAIEEQAAVQELKTAEVTEPVKAEEPVKVTPNNTQEQTEEPKQPIKVTPKPEQEPAKIQPKEPVKVTPKQVKAEEPVKATGKEPIKVESKEPRGQKMSPLGLARQLVGSLSEKVRARIPAELLPVPSYLPGLEAERLANDLLHDKSAVDSEILTKIRNSKDPRWKPVQELLRRYNPSFMLVSKSGDARDSRLVGQGDATVRFREGWSFITTSTKPDVLLFRLAKATYDQAAIKNDYEMHGGAEHDFADRLLKQMRRNGATPEDLAKLLRTARGLYMDEGDTSGFFWDTRRRVSSIDEANKKGRLQDLEDKLRKSIDLGTEKLTDEEVDELDRLRNLDATLAEMSNDEIGQIRNIEDNTINYGGNKSRYEYVDAAHEQNMQAAFNKWAMNRYLRGLYARALSKRMKFGMAGELSPQETMVWWAFNQMVKRDDNGSPLWPRRSVGQSKTNRTIQQWRYNQLVRWLKDNMWKSVPTFGSNPSMDLEGRINWWRDIFENAAARESLIEEKRAELKEAGQRYWILCDKQEMYRETGVLYQSEEEYINALSKDQTLLAEYYADQIGKADHGTGETDTPDSDDTEETNTVESDADKIEETAKAANLHIGKDAVLDDTETLARKEEDNSRYLEDPAFLEYYNDEIKKQRRKLEGNPKYGPRPEDSWNDDAKKAAAARMKVDTKKFTTLEEQFRVAKMRWDEQFEKMKADAFLDAMEDYRDSHGVVTDSEFNTVTAALEEGYGHKTRKEIAKTAAQIDGCKKEISAALAAREGMLEKAMEKVGVAADSADANLLYWLHKNISDGLLTPGKAETALRYAVEHRASDEALTVADVLKAVGAIYDYRASDAPKWAYYRGGVKSERPYTLAYPDMKSDIDYQLFTGNRYSVTALYSFEADDEADTKTPSAERSWEQTRAELTEAVKKLEETEGTNEAGSIREDFVNEQQAHMHDGTFDDRTAPSGLTDETKADSHNNKGPRHVSKVKDSDSLKNGYDAVGFSDPYAKEKKWYSDLPSNLKDAPKIIKEHFEEAWSKAKQWWGLMALSDAWTIERMSLKQTREDNLWVHLSMLRGASETTGFIFKHGLVSPEGRLMGKSFTEVFLVHDIVGRYNEEMQKIYEHYLALKMTEDRMSVEEHAQQKLLEYEEAYPELKNIAADELARMASEGNPIVKEYLRLIKWADGAKNKPVLPAIYDTGLRDVDGNPITKSIPLSAAAARAEADKMETQYKWLKPKADEMYAWWDSFMRMYAVGGAMSEAEYDLYHETYPHYIPTHRVDSKGKSKTISESYRNTANDIYESNLTIDRAPQKAEGSTRPLQSIPDQFANMVGAYVKSYRARELADSMLDEFLVDDSRQFSNFGRIVWDKSDRLFREAATEGAAEESELDGVSFTTATNGRQYLITTFRNGRQLTAQVSKEMFFSLKNVLGKQDEHYRKAIKAGNFITAPMKTAITGANPNFAVRNILSDLPTAFINTDNEMRDYAYAYIRAIEHMARGSDEWVAFKALGGTHSNYMKIDDSFVKAVNKNPGLKKVVDALSVLGETSESMTRFAEYLATVNTRGDDYINRMVGIHRSAEVTTDFSRAGYLTRLANSWVPYLNPAVQGVDKVFRSVFEDHDIKAALKTLGRAAWTTIPPELLLALWRALCGREKDFEEVSDYVKDNYYLIPLGGSDGNSWLRVRKNREWAALLGNSLMRLLEGTNGYNDPFGTYWDISIIGNFLPDGVIPLGLKEWLQLAENKNYAGSVIIPTTYDDFKETNPMLVYDEDTSRLAYVLASVASNVTYKLNPMAVDYLLSNYFGDFWSSLWECYSMGDFERYQEEGLNFLEIRAENLKNSAENFIALEKKAWVTDSRYSNSTVTRYYEMIKKVKGDTAAGKHVEGSDYDSVEKDIYNALYNESHGYAYLIQQLSKEARSREDGDEKAAIKAQIVELARKANDFYERCMDGEIADPVRYIKYNDMGDTVADTLMRLGEAEDGYDPDDYNFDPTFSCPSYITDPEDSSKQYVLSEKAAGKEIRQEFKDQFEANFAKAAEEFLLSQTAKTLSKGTIAAAMQQIASSARAETKENFINTLKEKGITSTAITLSSVEMADKEAQYALARVQNPSTAVSEAVSDELVRLNDYASEYSIVMSTSVPTTFQSQSNSKEVYTLTEDEQKYYTEQRSTLYNDAMTKVMESSDYTSGDDQYKAAMLEAAGKVVTKQLKADMQDYLDRHGATSTSRVKLSEGQLDEAASYSATEVLTPDNAYDSSVTDELVRLYSYSDTYSFQPSTYKPTKYTDPDDKSRVYVLTSEEQAKYQEISHDTYNAAVKKLMQTSDYKKADDEGKAQILAAMRDNLADTVKPKFLSWLASQRRSTAKADTTEEDELEEKVLAELGW